MDGEIYTIQQVYEIKKKKAILKEVKSVENQRDPFQRGAYPVF
jgi:hypothetical protein